MKSFARLVFLLFVLIYACSGQNFSYENGTGPTERFDNFLILVEPDIYLLYWSVNGTEIKFEVHYKCNLN